MDPKLTQTTKVSQTHGKPEGCLHSCWRVVVITPDVFVIIPSEKPLALNAVNCRLLSFQAHGPVLSNHMAQGDVTLNCLSYYQEEL